MEFKLWMLIVFTVGLATSLAISSYVLYAEVTDDVTVNVSSIESTDLDGALREVNNNALQYMTTSGAAKVGTSSTTLSSTNVEDNLVSQKSSIADLQILINNLNAANVSIADASALFTATDVEAALAETRVLLDGVSGTNQVGVGIIRLHDGISTGYDTITEALAAANSGDAVVVGPGTYTESINMPSGVRLLGFPAAQSVIIKPTGTQTTVTMANTCTIREMTIYGASAGSNAAVDCTGLSTNELAVFFNVVFIAQGGDGHLIEGAGNGICGILDIYHNGGNTSGDFMHFESGVATVRNPICNLGSSNACLHLTGNADCTVTSLVVTPTLYTSTSGIYMAGSSKLQIEGVNLVDHAESQTANGVHIAADGVQLSMTGAHIHGSVYDLFVDDGLFGSNTVISMTGEARTEAFQTPEGWLANAALNMLFNDDGVGNDIATRILGELSVGDVSIGAESAFGGGDSTVRTMMILSEDDGTFVDNTATASNRTGTFSLFQGNAVGNAAYIGSTGGFKFQFVNFKVDHGNTALSGGNVQLEYWNGSAWVEFDFMVTDANIPYAQKAKQLFQEANTDNQVRLNTNILSTWANTSVNGTDGYWLKANIDSVITTIPVIERIKLGPNRTEINKDGFLEFFGNAEALVLIPEVNISNFRAIAGKTPSDGTTAYSTSLSLTYTDNRFLHTQDDAFGMVFDLPSYVDTSRPLTLSMFWYPESTNNGNVVLNTLYASTTVGTNVDNSALTEANVETITAVTTGTNGILYRSNFDLDVSTNISGDQIVIGVFRNATSDARDTLDTSIQFIGAELNGRRWRT